MGSTHPADGPPSTGLRPAVAAGAKMSTHPVKLIECPRDAWQGMPQQIPVETKADYLSALIAAGFRHMDAVSFVSPAAGPPMRGSEQVLSMVGLGTGGEI